MNQRRQRISALLMEFIGTFILLATVQIAIGTNGRPDGQSPNISNIPSAVIALLISLVYMGYEISGANYNPVVTFILIMRGAMAWYMGLLYMLCQIVGGSLGALFGRAVSNFSFSLQVGGAYQPWQAVLAELFFTTVFSLAFLLIAVRTTATKNPLFGVTIPFIVYAGIICTVPISGFSLNPAIAIPLSVANGFDNFPYALMISLVNMASAVLGTVIFYVIDPDEIYTLPFFQKQKNTDKVSEDSDSDDSSV